MDGLRSFLSYSNIMSELGDAGIGLPRDVVQLRMHNPLWGDQYEEERNQLQSLLASLRVRFEHVGSTAVPGLDAKPIIDIDVALDSFDHFAEVYDLLIQAGYEYRDDASNKERKLFVKGPPSNRTHHIHVVEVSGACFDRDLFFRDTLRVNKMLRNEYQDHKRELAQVFPNDRKSYTEGKANVIQRILDMAHK
jgi:GrpB-like predicted nucleotidyltransferase (UPF0157 family)